MDSQRITVGISRNLAARLRQHPRAGGKTPSQLVRVARELCLRRGSVSSSAYESAREAGLIGCTRDTSPDLSSNLHHFQVFGKNK
jgi:hypothetical protein